MHKIDREKLREALQPIPQNRTVYDEIIITDAAANWLEITDPGFGESCRACNGGGYITGDHPTEAADCPFHEHEKDPALSEMPEYLYIDRYDLKGWFDKHHLTIRRALKIKAMIAAMGE